MRNLMLCSGSLRTRPRRRFRALFRPEFCKVPELPRGAGLENAGAPIRACPLPIEERATNQTPLQYGREAHGVLRDTGRRENSRTSTAGWKPALLHRLQEAPHLQESEA